MATRINRAIELLAQDQPLYYSGGHTGHVLAVARHQHFATGGEKHLDAIPGVGDEAGARASNLEQPRGW